MSEEHLMILENRSVVYFEIMKTYLSESISFRSKTSSAALQIILIEKLYICLKKGSLVMLNLKSSDTTTFLLLSKKSNEKAKTKN